ncbi:O-antigen ligase family protein [Botrimarina mediterranea]|uniref:O-Antigen ligase n=1 Tax=Botrimarina mediterranea TaxID=2528022 RepID=A0A518K6F5_9BACT|nr:O-antigen ligase family protein [Botrimarina mediterranea]QDV73375.1 O-Antigen ligase [Botrimarina mediterranea]QDV77892.1 O-Antigen ligase [Planctomycetes bacterium K2D]
MSSSVAMSGFADFGGYDDTPTDAGSIRWGRVLWVVAFFLPVFYYIDHDAEAFAGRQVADETEDDIADQYVDEIEGGSGLRKLVLITYGVTGLWCLMQCRDREWNVQRFAALATCALMAWILLSVFWSLNPGLTFKRIVAFGMVFVGSLGYARLLRADELLAVSLATFALLIGNSFFLDVVNGGKPWDLDYRFGGTLHPNLQSTYCAMLCLAAYCTPKKYGSQWVARALFFMGIVLLIQTQSRTSLFALLAALGMVSLVKLSSTLRWQTALLLLLVVSITTIAIASFSEGQRKGLTEAALMGRTEQSGTLSGRVPLWQELTRFASARPLTGYGFESFWTPENIDAVMRSQKWALQSAHNSYFETVLQLGLPGLVFACVMVLASFNLTQAAYEHTRASGYAYMYGVLGFGMANSLLESNFAKLKYPTVIALIGVLGVIAFYPASDSYEVPYLKFRRRRDAAPCRGAAGRDHAREGRQIA